MVLSENWQVTALLFSSNGFFAASGSSKQKIARLKSAQTIHEHVVANLKMSDSEKNLSGNIYYSRLLNGLDERIKKWSLEPLTGIGLVRGINGKFAHVELEISNHFNNSNTNKIIYKISENQLPIEFRVEIERTLSFFIDYLNSLKSDNFQLKFTILDATYHPVDSRPIDYQNAIMKAIANCFGKSFKPLSKVDKKIIDDCKRITLK